MYFIEFLHQVVATVTPIKMSVLFGGVMLGIIFGALPGLTATLAVALLSTVTFNLPTDVAIIALIGAYVGAVYGGCQSAILIGIPGTSAGAASVRDGHQLAKQGRAGETIANATMGSALGTIFGLTMMLLVMPVMVALALQFTSIEFFLLAVFGVLICGSLTSDDLPAKGWIAGILGLAISTVGIETIQGYSRFTFGVPELAGGIEFVPVILGAFAIPQIIRGLRDSDGRLERSTVLSKVWPDFKFLGRCKMLIARSGLIGVGVGAIPGVGEDVAAWSAYDATKRSAKDPETFGRGNMRGVIAPEVAANACIGGAIVPVLTLAVPGSPPAAMLLGAMWLHGLRPGPMLAIESPEVIPQIAAFLFWSAIAMAICGLAMARLSVLVLRLSPSIVLPMVAMISILGSYSLGLNIFNVYLMFGFGLLAFVLEEMEYPVAPLVIGLILGQMADIGLRRALLSAHGDVFSFFERPLALVFMALILYSLFGRSRIVRHAFGMLFGPLRRKGKASEV
ncbi:putative tricarboxylic transport membrane protein [Ancylobacter aquaticus]|uniref:Putative tricarboxylic transport membrane protein n=1 Tax=Ancylobacter aquaticus TaxID=100 RepID=A0A4R1IEE0_ANCAQ|nr:tripartite tricarboxylate transporter permease [Ancylobacter aquaticus]TCK29202.1 putative tricarboxylic transport membrane protein [Ancylobacter aquaticus]